MEDAAVKMTWRWFLGVLTIAASLFWQSAAAYELRAQDRAAIAKLVHSTGQDEPALVSALNLIGVQEVSDNDTLLIVSANQDGFRRSSQGVIYSHYFCIRQRDSSYQVVGDFWSNTGPTPFSGGVLIEGLPLIHDAVDPEQGYSHFVYWKGKYQDMRALDRAELQKVLELLFENPHTYKYLMDGSEGKSRFNYD